VFYITRIANGAGTTMNRSRVMRRTVGWGTALCIAAVLVAVAVAQDVPGIEICTRESSMDRRTGCLQSNVQFLQQVMSKNALDAQQKLSAANRDIAALKEQLAAAGRETAALKQALAAMEARIAQLEKAPLPKAEPKK
jgi:septal ring factor EnvC (AmiA/AmiB activator)